MTDTLRTAPARPGHRRDGAPQSPAPSGVAAPLLMTGPRTALTAQAQHVVGTVARALLVLQGGKIAHALAHTDVAPANDPWAPGGALNRVLLPDSLSPALRRTVARVLLQADTPRTNPVGHADDRPSTGPAPPRTGPHPAPPRTPPLCRIT
ncbi:hypothetical protein ACFU7Y_06435 [Kitasatospora sp. NPDC057542]|uniref:hypothetical protein n=1 Tax=Kitasatospora sp. NPDC057542 TaxID=3346162 RepID=UPI0036BAF54D